MQFALIAATAALGGLLFGYDTGVISSALLFIRTVFHLSTAGQSLVAGIVLVGAVLGAMVAGTLSDRFGRRRVILVTALAFVIGALLSAAADSVAMLLVGRLLIGIAIGVASMLTPLYLAEIAPAASRGAVTSLNQLCIVLGILASYMVGYAFATTPEGWRWMLGLGAVPGAILAAGMLVLPESPRWLAGHGRSQEAEAIIESWEVEARLEGAELPPPRPGAAEQGKGSFREIWHAPYLGRTLMLIAFNLFQAAGYYGFSSLVPALLIASGIAVTKSLAYTFVIAMAAPIGPALGLLFTDRVERKWIIAGAALAIAASGLAFTQAHGMVGVIDCGVALTLANNILSFAYHGYQPELFPTRVRARAVGFVYSFSRLSTMFSAFAIAWVLKGFGAAGVFVLIAGCMVVVALVIGTFGPRTKDLSLEQISR